MSKAVKKMELEILRQTFQDVRDMVLMSVSGLSCQADNQIRLGLRKKGIRLQVVKNNFAKRIFDELGVQVARGWEGPTTLAWGGSSIADLSKEIEGLRKKHEKSFKVKTAVADGREVTFAQALKMPTREGAIGRVLSLALAPASRLVGQILGPASQVAGQIKSIGDKKEAEPSAA